MNANSGPLTAEAVALQPLIDAALPSSPENTALIVRLGELFAELEKMELSKSHSVYYEDNVRLKIYIAQLEAENHELRSEKVDLLGVLT